MPDSSGIFFGRDCPYLPEAGLAPLSLRFLSILAPTMPISHSHPVLDAVGDTRWYLVHSKPRHENMALDHLVRQGYEAWLPMIKSLAKTRRSSRQGPEFVFVPLFPRYVFFRPAHPDQSIAPARSTQGVTRLVTFGVHPATLSHEHMRELALWVQSQHQQDAVTLANIRTGDSVQILQGPLAGLDALVTMTEKDRITVLLNLLGKDHPITLDVHAVALVSR